MARKADPSRKGIQLQVNPATLEVIGEVRLATSNEIKQAVAEAQEAFETWASFTLDQRAKYFIRARDYILDHMDEIAELISKENGKPRLEALLAEIYVVTDMLTYYCERAQEVLRERPIELHNPVIKLMKWSKIVYQPLGVVSVVTPWNYPFSIPMSGIFFALLAGNTVVFKPASDTALIGLKINEILMQGAGLPRGVFHTIVASGREMGDALFSPPVRKIVFTGSTNVGVKIQQIAARHMIPTVMELGGKDAMVVLPDANLDFAARGAVWGAFTNCGQVCSSVERCYVPRELYEGFVQRCEELTKQLRVGPDTDFNVEVGPLANEEQLRVVEEHVEDALKKGARVVVGGKRPEGLKGYFYEPTILTEVDHTMKAMTEETFGPLLPIMAYDSVEEAIRLANDSVYGLTASVWTRDRKKGEKVARRLEAGTVVVNDHLYTYGLCETPWQGMKESGIGRSHSDEGLLEFVYPKHLQLDRTPSLMRRRMWWYPYSGAAYEVQKVVTRAFSKTLEMPKLALALLKKDYRKALL